MDTNENKAEQEKIEKEKAELDAQKKIAEQEKIQLGERMRLSELKKAFPDDLEFAIEQFEAGASLIEAKAAYADVLQKRLTEKENGADPLLSGDSNNSEAGENWLDEGKKLAKEQKIPLGRAYQLLAATEKGKALYAAYKQSLGL